MDGYEREWTGNMTPEAKLIKQTYGLAMAQGKFGGPKGVWLECTTCDISEKISGSGSGYWFDAPDSEVAAVFRRAGWTGKTNKMLRAKCPTCSGTRHPDREIDNVVELGQG